MSFYKENTSDILGKIASLKTIVEKSKSKINASKSQANSLMDSLMEIFMQIGGYDDMLQTIEKILSEKIEDIEEAIKSAIKIAIKQIISCSVEPTVSESLIYTGITFSISEIDPNTMLTIDPLSENGSYAYFDNLSGIDSKDFNVFLYTLIKNTINSNNYDGCYWYKTESDGNEQIKVPLLHASYNEYDISTQSSNIITIKINERFKNEKLSFFISEFLDSIKLFNNIQVLSSIFDDLFSTKIIKIEKTSEQLVTDEIVSKIVDKILNNIDDGDIIDDSYYQFSNDVYAQMLEDAEKKKAGKYSYNDNVDVSISQTDLLSYFENLKTDNLLITEQTNILSETINQITEDIAKNPKIDEKQKYNIKINIVNNIIKKLMITITNYIFSPKILYLFVMSNELLNTKTDTSIIEFIKSNINLYKTIILRIRDILTKELTSKLTELLAPMIKQVVSELVKEKFALYKKQIDTIKNAIDAII